MKLGKFIGAAALAGSGFAAYKMKKKIDGLKAVYDDVIVFSGDEKQYDEFDGASIAVIFGGLEVDLTSAKMVGNSATLKIHGEFCGVDIKVPSHWNVKAIGTSEKADFRNNVVYDGEDDTSKLLIIDYDIKYAGLNLDEDVSTEMVYPVEDARDDDPELMPDPYDHTHTEQSKDEVPEV